MMTKMVFRGGAILLAALLLLAPEADARCRSAHPRPGSTCLIRDPAQRRAFQRTHPCPSTGRKSGACPGYVVDHMKPLKRGGADRPWNMQWQTQAAAAAKDRTE
jgi:hypothetical protein